MSNLTQQELNAGVSIRALETIRAKENSNGAAKPPRPTRAIDGTTEIAIVATPWHRLSLLETSNGKILIRDACFVGSKCDVQLIHLDYEQAHTLAKKLLELQDPDNSESQPSAPSKAPTRRLRANA